MNKRIIYLYYYLDYLSLLKYKNLFKLIIFYIFKEYKFKGNFLFIYMNMKYI